MKNPYNLDFYSESVQGKLKEQNEDYFQQASTPNGDVFVVCDGLGGLQGGEIASRLASEVIVNYFKAKAYTVISKALLEALTLANIAILERSQELKIKMMGTTACVLVVTKDAIYYAHIGDSRIYWQTRRKLHRQTKDHSYVQELFDKREVSKKDVKIHPKRNLLTQCLGIKKDINPSICKKPLCPAKGDRFLMCTDGLTDVLDDKLILKVLKTSEDLKSFSKTLIDESLCNGSEDDITLLLLRVNESFHKKALWYYNTIRNLKRLLKNK